MPKRLKGPVHQNDYAYEHMRYCKHNLPPDKVFVSMYGGMCRHCRELMDWKRKYGKWKILSPFTQEARICTHCAQKTVFHPFAPNLPEVLPGAEQVLEVPEGGHPGGLPGVVPADEGAAGAEADPHGALQGADVRARAPRHQAPRGQGGGGGARV
eukprot:TRINITY_DN8576_c0_g1_i1.p3 TRINITY_DN8576_c0_g1~~TRINITY_DN8576_c0_g1_i1.p3  ORF type:complete len:163 (-),score=24.61 TRINITY_DN8576_c0_g1_i1:111-575(-)